jgi:hypothetical protein
MRPSSGSKLLCRPSPIRPIVGVLWQGSAEEEGPYFKALLEGFRDLGCVDGRNITLEHRFPNEMLERFESMAAELASLIIDVLVAVGEHASTYARNASLCSCRTLSAANWCTASHSRAGTQQEFRIIHLI